MFFHGCINSKFSSDNWSGAFTVGELLTGADSGAVYQLKAIEKDNTVSGYPDNDEIELEADNIIDFTENNPFGEF